MEDDAVFRALADPTRRLLLDRLREREGQILSELEADLPMTRFGVMKHLRLLEEAGLVVSRKVGRERHHYLNPVPIQRVADRWVGRFREAAGLLADLSDALEGTMTMTATSNETSPAHVFETYIKAAPEQLWRALTESEFTLRYYFASTIESTFEPGAPYLMKIDGNVALEGEIVDADPPRRLVQTFCARWDDNVRDDPPSRLTWEIEAQGPMCKLTVVHDGFTSRTATYEQSPGGMPLILAGLKTLLETGEPLAG